MANTDNELEILIRARADVQQAFDQASGTMRTFQQRTADSMQSASAEMEKFNYAHYTALKAVSNQEAEALGIQVSASARRRQLYQMDNEALDRLYQQHVQFQSKLGEVQSTWQQTVTALSTGFMAIAEIAEFAFGIVRAAFDMVTGLARTFIGAVMSAVEAADQWGRQLRILQVELGGTLQQSASLQAVGRIFGVSVQSMGASFGMLLANEDKAASGMGRFANEANKSKDEIERYQYSVSKLNAEIDKLHKAQNIQSVEKTRDRELRDAATAMKDFAASHKQTLDDITIARQDALDALAAHTLAGDDAKYKRDADIINDRYDLQIRRANEAFAKEKEKNSEHVADIKERTTDEITNLKAANADRLDQLKKQLKQEAELHRQHQESLATIAGGGSGGGGGQTALQRLLGRIGPDLKLGTSNVADFYTQLSRLREELNKMPATEKTAVMFELMRRGGQQMVEVLSLQDDKWKLVLDDVHRLHLDNPKLVQDAYDYTFAQGRLNNALEAIKINIGTGLLPAFVKLQDRMTEWITKHIDSFQKAGNAVGDFLMKAIDPLFNTLEKDGPRILKAISDGLLGIFNAITGKNFASWQDFINSFANIKATDIEGAFRGIAGTVKDVADQLKDIVGFITFIKDPVNSIKQFDDKQKAIRHQLDSPGRVDGKYGYFDGPGNNRQFHYYQPGDPQFGQTKATGGFGGGRTLVGERGPELVDLPQGSYVHTADQTRQMQSGGQTIINTFNVRNESDPTAIARFLSFQLSHAGRF